MCFYFCFWNQVDAHRLHLSHPSQPHCSVNQSLGRAACLLPSLSQHRSCSPKAVKPISYGLTLYTVQHRAVRIRMLGPDDGSKGTPLGAVNGTAMRTAAQLSCRIDELSILGMQKLTSTSSELSMQVHTTPSQIDHHSAKNIGA